ncbi:ribosome binding protein [Babesia caballi]|uniref:Ribosome binding protein n=1 Tax=Babesia caballi TaxID=5871 RepID=A0AAV4LPE5_BABCB|nr:ribosome binding protein [Babesia caballi]
MARIGRCSGRVRVPHTLKSGLEFLDMLYKDTYGLKRTVYRELENQFNTDYDEHITVTLENVFTNTSQLRFRIIGSSRIRSYGDYEGLKNSTYNGESCAYEVICLLVGLLPRLRVTLEFLEPKVKDFSATGWGRPNFGDPSNESELHKWLTKSSTAHGKNELPGGYRPTHLIRNTGNSLHPSLFNLVDKSNGYLVKLCARLKRIESRYPPYFATPILPPPVPPPNASASQGSPAQSQSSAQQHGHPFQYRRSPSSEHQTRDSQSHQPQYPPEEPPSPPPEPSHNDGSSSTAAIGGAVGATGLVGGSAAVYFLNVGGIRTLIAG